jgi:predicted phosphoadenosine phosphosulfate sulfurtransferase
MKEKIERYINQWEKNCYFDGIPDEVPKRINELKKAPSYKAICMAILKNDYQLKSLGFTPKKSSLVYKLKGDKLRKEGKLNSEQLKLF